jgi:hypothetical protein
MERYALNDLKLIYRVLHRRLTEHTELLDSRFFEDLQRLLHRRAQDEGVDIADHGAWDAWLGNEAVGCVTRMERRAELN